MNKVIPASKDEWLSLRSKVITSTEVSALFNLNPYVTQFELWHRKNSGDIVSIEETERMRWGNYLQSSIAEGAAAQNSWKIREMKEFIYTDDRMGSSFDYEIVEPVPAILEIKNVDWRVYNKEWKESEAPPHIELQVQHQMLLSGHDRAFIGALIGGNELVMLKRKASKNIQEMISMKVKQFWDSIDSGECPAPNFQRDAEFITSLYQTADPDKHISVTDDDEISQLAQKYKEHSEIIKAHENKKDEIKAKLLTLINDAEKVKGNNFTISAGIVGEAQISFTRKPFRNFKITYKKGET